MNKAHSSKFCLSTSMTDPFINILPHSSFVPYDVIRLKTTTVLSTVHLLLHSLMIMHIAIKRILGVKVERLLTLGQ